MRGPGPGLHRHAAVLALLALAGCATREEGPLVEAGGAPIAGLGGAGAASSPEAESPGLLAVSGNAMLLGGSAVVAAAPSDPGPSLAALAGAAPGAVGPDGAAGPALARNAQPTVLPPPVAALPASPVTAVVQGVLSSTTAVAPALSPVTLGVQSVLTPATATNPGAATTQLANALVSTLSRVTSPDPGAPLLSPTAPGGASLGRLVSGLTAPLGD